MSQTMQTTVQPIAADPVPLEDGLQLLRDDAGLRLWRIRGETGRLVVCFSGVGADPALPPPPEWQRLAAHVPRDHLLFVADPSRTWLNREGLIEEIVDAIEAEVDHTGATQVCTLGHSMGGFSALVIPAFTHVDVAVAMSPQFAADPAVVPNETRWTDYRDAIPVYRVSNAADHIIAGCQYYVFFGRHPREAVQRDLAQAHENLELYVMPGTHHNTPQKMKAAGVLDMVINACFAGKQRVLNKTMGKTLQARRMAVAGATDGSQE
jgi:hypothetical protein